MENCFAKACLPSELARKARSARGACRPPNPPARTVREGANLLAPERAGLGGEVRGASTPPEVERAGGEGSTEEP